MRNARSRIRGYVEEVAPKYTNEEFRRKFRMSVGTFILLCNLLRQCPELVTKGIGGREPLSVEKQLYITLWYLGGTDSINRVADRFGISESSVILSRRRVMNAVLNNLLSKIISWPANQMLQESVANFRSRNGFPGIVGALDGTHIAIIAPHEKPQSYVNRKKYHSLQLQAVCNSDMLFLDCFAGFPGSCHDARILRNSDLWGKVPQLCNANHILADGAYPLHKWLLTPYRDNGHLTQEQKKFNYLLSANRVVIERAFGLLKGRFRRLSFIDTHSIQDAVKIIMTSCVFHNICQMQHEDIEFLEIAQDQDLPVQHVNVQEDNYEGIAKRNHIARTLFRH